MIVAAAPSRTVLFECVYCGKFTARLADHGPGRCWHLDPAPLIPRDRLGRYARRSSGRTRRNVANQGTSSLGVGWEARSAKTRTGPGSDLYLRWVGSDTQ